MNRITRQLCAAQIGCQATLLGESYALFSHLSVLDNEAFSLKMRGVSKTERHQRACRCASGDGKRAARTWSRITTL